MSLDRSLKSASSLVRHRNVLTRAERLERLKEAEKWDDNKNSPLGLPKVANRKVDTGKGGGKEAAEEGAAPAAGGAAPAAGAKAATPAAGAKGAAPAAAAGKAAAAPAAGAKKK